eukprot:COSAG04_NODE_3354_length_2900_cov_14.029275_2_plen_771_part_01
MLPFEDAYPQVVAVNELLFECDAVVFQRRLEGGDSDSDSDGERQGQAEASEPVDDQPVLHEPQEPEGREEPQRAGEDSPRTALRNIRGTLQGVLDTPEGPRTPAQPPDDDSGDAGSDAEREALREFLASSRCLAWLDQLEALGVECVADLSEVTEADLEQMGMKPLQRRRILDATSSSDAAAAGGGAEAGSEASEAGDEYDQGGGVATPERAESSDGGLSPALSVASVGSGSDAGSGSGSGSIRRSEPAAERQPYTCPFLLEAMERLSSGLASKRKAREAFDKMDKDMSGELDAAELATATKCLNLDLDPRHIDALMLHLDRDGDGSVSTDEFLAAVWEEKLVHLRKKFQAAAYTSQGVDLDLLFRQYDHDGSGELEFEEFRQAVRKTGRLSVNQVPDGDLREMFRHVDKDGGGTIGIEEFKELLHVAEDTTEESLKRYESVAGQVFHKILVESEKRQIRVLRLFHRFDEDDSGGLEPEEFRRAMLELGVMLDDDELEHMMDEMDNDGDGYINALEFCTRMRVAKRDGRAHAKQQQAARVSSSTPDSARAPSRSSVAPPSAQAGQSCPFLLEAMERLSSGLASKRKAREAFDKMDKDSSGELDAAELATATKCLNLDLDPRHIDALMLHLDRDGDGSVSTDEFIAAVWEEKLVHLRKKFQAAAYTSQGVDLDLLFRQYDHDGSGELEFEEFRQAVRKTGRLSRNEVPDGDLREMFRHVDKDDGGTIGIEEFKELLHVDEDTTAESLKRHESVAGQVFHKILVEAESRQANL